MYQFHNTTHPIYIIVAWSWRDWDLLFVDLHLVQSRSSRHLTSGRTNASSDWLPALRHVRLHVPGRRGVALHVCHKRLDGLCRSFLHGSIRRLCVRLHVQLHQQDRYGGLSGKNDREKSKPSGWAEKKLNQLANEQRRELFQGQALCCQSAYQVGYVPCGIW